MGRVAILIGLAAVGIGTARSQDMALARECVGITQNAARLECYDKAFGAAPRPEAQFGDTGQLRSEPARKEAVPKRITSIVQSVTPLANGLYRLGLNNDQVWETREANWAIGFKSNDAVTISRLPLGSYQISLGDSTRSVAAKRVK